MKLLFFVILLFTSSVISTPAVEHEYYVSVTTVEYADQQKSLQIISQIFIDDFENALRQRYDSTVVLNKNDESDQVEAYMKRYFNSKLKVWVNEQAVEFKFIGKEYKEDIAYCYLEIEDIASLQTIKVKNTVLFDVFETQQNIVRLKAFDTNKSFLLVPDNDECVLNFD
jgi:hypothetical protein